jgi:RimJ/RimL family protein N-acetyltransferase
MPNNVYTIREATVADIELLLEHNAREIAENGMDGVIFAPYEPEAPKPITDERRAQIRKAMELRLDEPFWQRAWLIVDTAGVANTASNQASERVVGSATLYGARLSSELHRCTLGMGIERPQRSRGLGRQLLDTAIVWAKAQPQLHWMDLGVFAGNTIACKLYERAGFVRTGQREDAFRVLGTSVTDISMSLALR